MDVYNTARITDGIRLSVIVPAYNCREYLNECLQSVLRQLPPDCELIIVDDRSDDGTADLLVGYEGKRNQVHTVYLAHKGASSARNAGLDTARGEFVTFLDCDDCMRTGFLRDSLPLLDGGTDLYIFGIERIPLSGVREFWTVHDRIYPDASAFADEYVRIRRLLIYSNCNKFYRRSVIEQLRLRFDESMDFGEDRLFNFRYLSGLRGRILTSSLIMLRYIQRSTESMSSKHIPDYFSCVLFLHEAKMDCFLTLSYATTMEEQLDFIACDITNEVKKTLDRFKLFPGEKEENLPAINRLVFGESDGPEKPPDVLVVLGGSGCEYKIRRAWEIGRRRPGILYIVSGGNPGPCGAMTEAEFMASWLTKHDVSPSDICIENRAAFTEQNLEFAAGMIRAMRSETGKALSEIGILTDGFHIQRARLLATQIPALEGEDLRWFAAYGPLTHPDDWFDDPAGRDIVLRELHKTVMLRSAANLRPSVLCAPETGVFGETRS